MKLTLAEPKYLKDTIGIISELVPEATLKVKEDGLHLTAMDQGNIAMVIFSLSKEVFLDFEVEKEEDLYIELSMLKQVLKRSKSNEVITLEVQDNKLKITMESNNKKTFYIPLLNDNNNFHKDLTLEFKNKIETKSEYLADAIEDTSIIGEAVSFILEDKKFFKLEAKNELSKVEVTIPNDDNTIVTCNDEKDLVRTKYALDYLKKMISGMKISDKVNIHFQEDFPLKLEFIEENKVSLSFVLAPRQDNY